jgi:hypothetical protein
MDFAVALAKEHGAHLLGIAFAPTALLPLYGADVGFADMTEVLASVKAQGESALGDLKARAASAGVSTEARLIEGMSEEFPGDFACEARHVDIAVLGQPRRRPRSAILGERARSPRDGPSCACQPPKLTARSLRRGRKRVPRAALSARSRSSSKRGASYF